MKDRLFNPLTKAPVLPNRFRVSTSFIVLIALAVAGFLVLLTHGSVDIPLSEVVHVLLGGEASRPVHGIILFDARLPKAITAVSAGAALGIGGALMQTLFRNPLADPYVLGVSSGAILGAAIVILGTSTSGWLSGLSLLHQLGVTGAAIAGAAVVLLLTMVFAQKVRNPATVLIVGVMFGFLSSALVDVLVYYADPDRLVALAAFTRGTVREVTWQDLRFVVGVSVAVTAFTLALAKPMNVMLLGERYAATMGINVKLVQIIALGLVAVLAGAITAFCGAIGFVGLAAPHLVRTVLGDSDHRLVLPGSALVGAILVLFAEAAAGGNGLTKVALPLNSVTAFIGAPIVLWVLIKRRRESGDA
ncbi:MAG: iron ABC transporter permease [Rhizobium sp.]|nr:iron ABC transporter permease [Rhizobium sp.]